MRYSWLALTLLFPAMLCAAEQPDRNAFMGHYGYLLSYPTTYTTDASFQGDIEVAYFSPQACRGMSQRSDCSKIGMVELSALPKKVVAEELGAPDFATYIAKIAEGAKRAGLKTRIARKKQAGLPGALIEMPGHPQALNTMILVEGKKVYYRFKYNAKTGAKLALTLVDSLKELAPHDNPPPPTR